MTIDWIHFTPWASLAGGVLLGVASALFILFNGRVLGISGILGGLLSPKKGDVSWRVFFILGMFVAPLAWNLLVPASYAATPVRFDATLPVLIIAGLLVGVGTRYGAGCTSGHGVCGLSRLSPRSLVATASFMAVGFLTVYLIRHVFG